MITTTTTSPPRSARRAIAALAVCTGLLAVGCGSSDDGDQTSEGATADTAPMVGATGAGITSGPPDGTEVVDGGDLVFGIEAEPAGLDPSRFAFSSAGHLVASAVFDPLATLDGDGNAVPYLAEGFESSDDDKTWTITLPEGVTFHDGSAFDADAVVANLEAYRTSTIVSSAFWAFDTIEATDPTTVTITLTEPYANLPALFTAQAGYMAAPVMFEDASYGLAPIGTGPFRFDSHTPDQLWSFTANEDYWREGEPHLDSIDFVPIPDNSQRLSDLRSAEIDIMYTQRSQQVNELRSSDFKLVEFTGGDESMLVLNTSKPPFDSLTARRAVAFATDAAGWRANNPVEQPANSPFSEFQPGYLEDNGYPEFDMEQAKALVAEYEAETGGPLAFSFTTQEDLDNLTDADFFAETYREAGMEVTIAAIPQINLVATVATGNYEMARFRIFNQPDPDADSHFWRTSSIGDLVSLNFPRYENPDVDAAINRALATDDEAERDAAYQEVNRIFAENVPYVWLGRSTWVLAADPRVNGIYDAANGSLQTVGPKTWIAGLWIS